MKSFKQFLKESILNEYYSQEQWDKLDSRTKDQYIKEHPTSKYAKKETSSLDKIFNKPVSINKSTQSNNNIKSSKSKDNKQTKKIIDGFRDPNETGADSPDIIFDHDGYEVRMIPQIDYDKPVKSWEDLEMEPMFYDENGDEAYPDIDIDIPDDAKKKFIEFYNNTLKNK